MRSPCDPPKFDEKDWSQFDFSRWHAEGVSGEEMDKTLTDLATQFFQSPEWSEKFRAGLPELKTQVRGAYEAELRALGQERQSAEKEFDERIKAAEKRAESSRQSGESAAGPVILQSRPDTFQLAVRVIEEKSKFGLPGAVVRVMDPRNPDVVLHETITDREGNAVVGLTPEDAKELDKIHAGLQIVAPTGKTIENLPAAVCIRLNGAETKVIAVKDSPDIEESKKAAAAAQAARNDDQKHLLARVERLKAERTERLRDIDCRVKDVQTLIAQLREGDDTPGGPPPTPREPERPPVPVKRAAARKKGDTKNR
jgi:hypothetical protein